jgi:precorrin-6Y C5,15-methyltransferase (decarboxylating)
MIWIDVIGLGETQRRSGLTRIDADTLAALQGADLVVGAKNLSDDVRKIEGFGGAYQPWPVPFLDIIPLLEEYRGRSVVILATGDPLWYGAASTLVRYFSNDDMRITPTPSGFQWAASRMCWPLHSARTMTVHGRHHEAVLKFLQPSARILILAHDRNSPLTLARLLVAAGYEDALITALGHIGGGAETHHEALARDWAKDGDTDGGTDFPAVPDFHVIAITCPDVVCGFLPLTPGLADDAFQSDGKLTKAETRAATLAKLKPQDGGLLWDLGCGSGAVGIEWMRAVANGRTIGIDHRDDRLSAARRNAFRLGVPEWQGLCLDLPDGVADLPDPDAVFIGGGLTLALADIVFKRLKHGGRLVINAVTLESEQVLLHLWGEYGGDLSRIAIARAEPIGGLHGFRPLMPVTQWAVVKHGRS